MGDFFEGLNPYEYVVLSILLTAFLVQTIYYLLIFIKVPRFKSSEAIYSNKKEPVSIIICARNEAENLTEYLPLILEQDYPDFEVIVVNDCSDDNSDKILEKLQEKYKHLRTTQIKHDEKFTHGKKLALTIGIKAAKNDLLLLTDADCKPNSKNWLALMQRNFTPQKDIVLGYGGYFAEPTFLNKLIRFDTFIIALQYMSFALIGKPYMGVGRNLAYRKSLYIKNRGFASHAHLVSGDDDLFVNETANSKNTAVEFSHESHTLSIPKKKFAYWINQKRRHLSTGNRYKSSHKTLLGLEVASRFFFYLSLILVVINPSIWFVGLGLYLIRFIFKLSVLGSALKRFNEKNLLFASIIFDIVLPLIQIILYFGNALNTKQYKWN
jgi:glycosyltransferase involved in cell wall biosynthesis